MTQESATPPPGAPPDRHGPIELGSVERRVLGVLIEKGMTTPDQYPLTMNALVNGCNQKSNRDPIMNVDELQVDAALQSLIEKGLVVNSTGSSGRVDRFSSQMGKFYELRSVEIAILGELLLRGPQTEGELRIRASRMRDIPDLGVLAELLTKLRTANPPFVVRLTPEGISRGVRYTHTFYTKNEMRRILADEATAAPATEAEPAAAPMEPSEADTLRARIAALEERVAALERKIP